jgi:hypothetical protein
VYLLENFSMKKTASAKPATKSVAAKAKPATKPAQKAKGGKK